MTVTIRQNSAAKNNEPGVSDHALFRKVMGSFASGITVITTEADGEFHGMTMSAFMSGSLQPPLCITSVSRAARTHGYLLKTGHFGVSVLARGQERLSAHYGGCPDPQLDPQLEPIGRTRGLAGAAAIIGADVIARHDCGDHSIFIGQIVEMRANPGVVPLVLHAGRFASLAYTVEADLGPIVEFW